jgi:hypothetical protein
MLLTDIVDFAEPRATLPHSYLGTGRTADRLYDIIQAETRTEPLLATLFWQIMLRSPAFARSLAQLDVNAQTLQRVEPYVVPGTAGRFDLVVLDPGRSAETIQAVTLEASRDELVIAWRRWSTSQPWSRTPLPELYRTSPPFPTAPTPAELLDVVDPDFPGELLARNEFRVLVARLPETQLTATPPVPMLGVSIPPDPKPTATAGIVATDRSGVVGVTTAHHALGAIDVGDPVLVGPHSGKVRSLDMVSDSAFVEVPGMTLPGDPAGLRGVLRGLSPREGPASFEGIASGPVSTRVTGWSPDIPLVQPYSQLKVLTTPATAAGDSGCALMDIDGYILGFAFYRTGLGQPVEFSAWIWAHSVCEAHGLA